MNKKRGISMILFVISIAMVLVLVTAVTTSYNVIINSARMREFGSEINMIQKAVDEYKFLNEKYPEKGEYTLYLDLVSPSSRISQFETSGDRVEMYIIDLKKLGIEKIDRGSSNDFDSLDVYAVSKENGKVYYLAGVKIDRTWYYTLTDDLKEKLDI